MSVRVETVAVGCGHINVQFLF